MPTMSGFRHAPITKGFIFVTVGASIWTQALKASRRAHFMPSLTEVFIFRSPAELLFGTIVLYYFRLLERESGCNKFGAFVAVSTGLSAALQWAAGRSALRLPPCPSGPYGLIFACFVQYFFLVPASTKMTVLGWRLSDKVFMYLLGVQLLMSSGLGSLVAGGAGLLAGLAYRFNVLRVKRFRFPAFVSRFFAATLGPLLSSEPSATPATVRQATVRQPGAAPAAGAPAPRRGGGGGAGAPEAPSAPHLPAASREAVDQLVAMGFPEGEATRALQLTNNDVQGAIGLLLSA